VTAAPLDIVAVVAQLYTAFCDGDYDIVERLRAGRGLSADEAAGALRSAGIHTWQRAPQDSWESDDVESAKEDDGTWSVSVPVWSDGAKTGARLRFTVEDVFGDDEFWEPWIVAVDS
jgi:hypothetical protein